MFVNNIFSNHILVLEASGDLNYNSEGMKEEHVYVYIFHKVSIYFSC